MLCGLPASGKSTLADNIYMNLVPDKDITGQIWLAPDIHSSDKLRKELFGSEEIQRSNEKLFAELHKRIRKSLTENRDAIYDATNINKKQRIEFLRSLKNIKCRKICLVMATPIEECKQRNIHRKRVVPESVIDHMALNWSPPHHSEGFDEIRYVYGADHFDDYTIPKFFSVANGFDQHNYHHSLSLGRHCEKAAEFIQAQCPSDFDLLIAAILHDNGKLYTRSFLNKKGIDDGNAHYYQHHNRGSYDAMFYLCNKVKFSDTEITDITTLIYYHMHPHLQWKQSERCRERDRKLLGDDLFTRINWLYKADIYAQ